MFFTHQEDVLSPAKRPSPAVADFIVSTPNDSDDIVISNDVISDVKIPKKAASLIIASNCSSGGAREALRRGVLARALRLLSLGELQGEAPLVCVAWRKAAVIAFAEAASDMGSGDGEGVLPKEESSGGCGRGDIERERAVGGEEDAAGGGSVCGGWRMEKLVTTFPWGGFLSEGACKKVRIGRKNSGRGGGGGRGGLKLLLAHHKKKSL